MIKINWDYLGISASLACAIHCAILPILFTTLPVFGVNIINNIWFETIMILATIVIGFFAIYHSYKKHHHAIFPFFLFGLGVAFIIIKEVWENLHLAFLLAGVACIVAAHVANYRLCRKANHCHSSDCNH
jgi:hypothetical protein